MTFLTEIPNNIKSKVLDKDWSLNFKFEDMPCNHPIDAKDFLKVNCEKCNYDERETWLETTLSNQSLTEKIKEKDGTERTLSKIIVLRGRYDDCMGIQKEFS